MDDEKIRGYNDQELLLRALVAFASNAINRSEQITKGMMRQCITEWVKANNISLKELRPLEEGERLKAVNEIIDIFLEKIKHLVVSKFQRDNLKKNILQIYNHWKNTKRDSSSEDLVSELQELEKSE
jgi:hypothetical protein